MSRLCALAWRSAHGQNSKLTEDDSAVARLAELLGIAGSNDFYKLTKLGVKLTTTMVATTGAPTPSAASAAILDRAFTSMLEEYGLVDAVRVHVTIRFLESLLRAFAREIRERREEQTSRVVSRWLTQPSANGTAISRDALAALASSERLTSKWPACDEIGQFWNRACQLATGAAHLAECDRIIALLDLISSRHLGVQMKMLRQNSATGAAFVYHGIPYRTTGIQVVVGDPASKLDACADLQVQIDMR